MDRALGYEANYAGTSFLTPDKLGEVPVRFEAWSNMTADRNPGACAGNGSHTTMITILFRRKRWPLVSEGIFVDYQTTREQGELAQGDEVPRLCLCRQLGQASCSSDCPMSRWNRRRRR